VIVDDEEAGSRTRTPFPFIRRVENYVHMTVFFTTVDVALF
jgi:hypothetical protein